MTSVSRGGRLLACDICGAPLSGNQKRFCSTACKAQAPPRVQKPNRCADCGVPVRWGSERCRSCRGKRRVGPLSGAWKAESELSDTAARERANKMYPLETCEWPGCDKPAVDHHHVDANVRNNARSNIQCLCRKHHMEADGRARRPERLSPQQQGILAEAVKHDWVSARMFAGAVKGWSNPRYRVVTLDSASAALRRLADRGLLERDEINPAIFRITDLGRSFVPTGGSDVPADAGEFVPPADANPDEFFEAAKS